VPSEALVLPRRGLALRVRGRSSLILVQATTSASRLLASRQVTATIFATRGLGGSDLGAGRSDAHANRDTGDSQDGRDAFPHTPSPCFQAGASVHLCGFPALALPKRTPGVQGLRWFSLLTTGRATRSGSGWMATSLEAQSPDDDGSEPLIDS
jgi:hypothetical protein